MSMRRTVTICVALSLASGACAAQKSVGDASLGGTDFVVPRDYQGPVVVWFSQPDGEPIVKTGGRAVFHVPQTGLVKVRNAEPARSNAFDMRFRREGTDSWTRPLSTCIEHRHTIVALHVDPAPCFLPQYMDQRSNQELPAYVALAYADSSHLAAAYDDAARLITARIFGEADKSFRWIEPRPRP